jgi:hypothetical protein
MFSHGRKRKEKGERELGPHAYDPLNFNYILKNLFADKVPLGIRAFSIGILKEDNLLHKTKQYLTYVPYF